MGSGLQRGRVGPSTRRVEDSPALFTDGRRGGERRLSGPRVQVGPSDLQRLGQGRGARWTPSESERDSGGEGAALPRQSRGGTTLGVSHECREDLKEKEGPSGARRLKREHTDDLENRSRWNNIHIRWALTGAEEDDIAQYVGSVFCQNLEDDMDKEVRMDSVHRVGPPDRPRLLS
ncbi:hypothetical protein NDU88_001434 [Pleurodeles waltl]|uniref:Uncharacterized protein n=1 Tax=Pleurodeles waltl TaxID=8319 RepID=A0AAV7V9U0_PLEWA|nr:hypothetical protein NDU88_001434 [Pleurodeles waltl]